VHGVYSFDGDKERGGVKNEFTCSFQVKNISIIFQENRMKKTLFLALFTVIFTTVANANDIFDNNCAACHAGGKNMINPDKTLSMADLEKNGVNTVEAIKTLVRQGKPPMPTFSAILDEKQIDEVANYVLEQAKKGW
jgi:cytochrome c6